MSDITTDTQSAQAECLCPRSWQASSSTCSAPVEDDLLDLCRRCYEGGCTTERARC